MYPITAQHYSVCPARLIPAKRYCYASLNVQGSSVRPTPGFGPKEGQGSIYSLDFGSILLNVLIILVSNNKWLRNDKNDLQT